MLYVVCCVLLVVCMLFVCCCVVVCRPRCVRAGVRVVCGWWAGGVCYECSVVCVVYVVWCCGVCCVCVVMRVVHVNCALSRVFAYVSCVRVFIITASAAFLDTLDHSERAQRTYTCPRSQTWNKLTRLLKKTKTQKQSLMPVPGEDG